MNRTEIKQKAQDALMTAAQSGFYAIYEKGNVNEEDAKIIAKEMDIQMTRIEKLFGYTPGSWGRG